MNTHRASLTPEQAFQVLQRYADGESRRKLAHEHQVSTETIARLTRGDTYPEVWRQWKESQNG